MTIKGMNGENYNVTGQGQGNYNTVGASAGIASFLGLMRAISWEAAVITVIWRQVLWK